MTGQQSIKATFATLSEVPSSAIDTLHPTVEDTAESVRDPMHRRRT